MFGFRHSGGAKVENGRHVRNTIACVHCGLHWDAPPGGDTGRRGWCDSCRGMLCGKPGCMEFCLPYEARLDLEEGTTGGTAMRYRDTFRAFREFCEANADRIREWEDEERLNAHRINAGGELL